MRSTHVLDVRQLLPGNDQHFTSQGNLCELEMFTDNPWQQNYDRGHAASAHRHAKQTFMKLHENKQPAERGSVLLISLLTCTILATLAGSYLYMIENQRLAVARSQQWNQALVVAEAGVEEAMALLNSGVQAPNFNIFPWANAGGGVFTNDPTRPQSQFGSAYYQVSITNGLAGADPVIISTGYVPAPLGRPTLVRSIRVPTKARPTFPVKGPMIVEAVFNANGYNVGTDSFDSSV